MSLELRSAAVPRFQWNILGGTTSQFADFLAKDRETYRQVVADSKIPPMD